MLAHVLVFVSDSTARARLRERLDGRDLRTSYVEPGSDSANSVTTRTRDIAMLDRGALAALESADEIDRSTTMFVATDEPPEELASRLGEGWLAVLETSDPDARLEGAILGGVQRWRNAASRRTGLDSRTDELRLGDFVTASTSMQQFMKIARRVSEADSSVLILGETGVGKERLAAAIHAEGRRRAGPFVVVNCGAIPENLIESELFGHEKGAFTGADRQHRGFFEMAHDGTLLLDEIGELPLHLQVKLLRVLQDREVRRVGGEHPIHVDVRVIAATNRDLESEVQASRFRSDLFYRLGVVSLTIPPLRERQDDIPLLVTSYLESFRDELGGTAESVSTDAMDALCAYHWPGNVREVINVVERAVLLCETNRITLNDLPESIAMASIPKAIAPLLERVEKPDATLPSEWFELPLRDAKRVWNAAFEKLYLQRVLEQERGKIADVATRIGIDPRSLYTKMRAYGLRKEDYR